jgi:hypothetical protein
MGSGDVFLEIHRGDQERLVDSRLVDAVQ